MRLTKGWKEDVIKRIVELKTKKEAEELEKEFTDFGVDCIKKINKPYIDKILSLPKEYFRYVEQLRFKYGNGYREHKYIKLSRPFPVQFENSWNDVEIDVKGSDRKKLSSLIKKELDLKKFKYELKEELFKVITPCTTSKKLIDTFPEIEEYIEIPKDNNYPLVVQTEKLKRMLKS